MLQFWSKFVQPRLWLLTIALLGVSPSLAASERADAHLIAGEIGARVEEVETNEMELAGYRANAGDRCYYCKSALYDTVLALADRRNSDEVIFVGTQVDDLDTYAQILLRQLCCFDGNVYHRTVSKDAYITAFLNCSCFAKWNGIMFFRCLLPE